MAQAMQGAAYLNGKYVPASEANVSIFDSGFIGGVSVFDTLACWQGGLFKLPQHRARFERSAHAAMIPLAASGNDLEQIIIETTRRSGCREAYVQAIATRGRRPTPSAPSNEPTLIVYAIPYVSLWPEEKAERGISVMIPSIRQWPPSTLDAKIKNFNRMHTHLARLEAERAAADDIVLLDDRGLLTESRGSNLFVVRGGTLYTPRSGILEGITRQTVFEIAAELGIPAAEHDLSPYDLYTAEEAFLCSTAGGIYPIAEADGRSVGSGGTGPITRALRDRYWERHLSGPDVTPVFS
ncbi:MAG: aminotransferase class IV [Thermomicrobiales bacterium]|nr:aminotransferase class IV [Thermomicrobiales bacterium]